MADLHGPYRGERFVLDFGGKEIDGFKEIKIPKHETAKSKFRAGDDAAHSQQLWSTTEYEDLVVTRAVDNDLTLFNWRKKVQNGELDEARKDSIAVILKDEQGVSALRWNFTNAWPKEYRTPDLDATSNDIATETLVIAHEGMERK